MSSRVLKGPFCVAIAVLAMSQDGCAHLDALAVAETHRLDEGEFYAYVGEGMRHAVGPTTLLPVALDPELSTSFSYGARSGEFAPIVAAMNEQLRGESCCRYVAATARPGGAPRVYVGSADGELAPPEAQAQREPHDRLAPMVMHVRKPSPAWQQGMRELLAREGAGHAVVVFLGVSQYPKGREGTFGKKAVLGTGHEEPIRFMTAEDRLLEVLQLTGVLVDEQGRVVRAGAEGILVRDTPFPAQVVGVEKSIDERSLAQVLTTTRRSDLPGAPLSWEVSLSNLVSQLRGDRAALIVP